jgi:hypothetical protein
LLIDLTDSFLTSSLPFYFARHNLDLRTEYGQHLAEIALDPAVNWPIRQLASVLLKQFIEGHWSVNREKFEEPEIPADVKIRIRTMLISGMPLQSSSSW